MAWFVLFATVLVSLYFVQVLSENARMETNLDEYMPKTIRHYI